jgi:sialate O-acetylesterase
MIQDWRNAWGQGEFPFYVVQLANFSGGADWPRLREAQLKALELPNVGLAVAIDIGDSCNIHPANKREVGRRLALWAIAGIHGRRVETSGPLYAGMGVEGDKIRLRFTHAAGGLVAMGGKPLGFTIAGADRKFLPAKALIDGETLVLSNSELEFPVAVRYAWLNDPLEANLYNKAGLPASPFRTDVW